MSRTLIAALVFSAAAATLLACAVLPLPSAVAAMLEVPPPGGCHANAQFHYVEEWRRTAWHFHRVPDCLPLPAPADTNG